MGEIDIMSSTVTSSMSSMRSMSSMNLSTAQMSPNLEHPLLALVLLGLGLVPAQGQNACACEVESQSPLLPLASKQATRHLG